jgi:hypothetical protein
MIFIKFILILISHITVTILGQSAQCNSTFDGCMTENELYKVKFCVPLEATNTTKSSECLCLILIKIDECYKNCLNSTLVNELKKNNTAAIDKTCLQVGLDPLNVSPDKWIQFNIPGLRSPSLPSVSVSIPGVPWPTLPPLFASKSSRSPSASSTVSPPVNLSKSAAHSQLDFNFPVYLFAIALGLAVLL